MGAGAGARPRRKSRRSPDDPFAWFNLGTDLTALGRYEEAASAYDQARQLGLPWRMLWYQFGPFRAYYETGRYDEVIALADATLRTAKHIEELYYWKGLAQHARGDCRRPRGSFAGSGTLQFNPNFADRPKPARLGSRPPHDATPIRPPPPHRPQRAAGRGRLRPGGRGRAAAQHDHRPAFGIGADLDAYYAAFKLPDLLFTVVAGGALATAFIPVFADFLAAGRLGRRLAAGQRRHQLGRADHRRAGGARGLAAPPGSSGPYRTRLRPRRCKRRPPP